MSQEPTHIELVIADLEAWRDQIDLAIQTLRHFGAKGPALPSSAPPGTSRANGNEIPNDAFFQMTLPDAAEKYLRLVKATKETPEIAEALTRGGLKSSAKNFTDIVRTILSREDRFVRVPSGGWGLSEWYPAMRKEKKGKGAAPTAKNAETKALVKAKHDGAAAGVGETAADKVLAAMRGDRNGEWTATKLIGTTGLKPKTVQGTIFRLRKSGHITKRIGGKGYQLSEG